jgi:glucose-6-phosphate dehydrogenase assembly protein OpcA
MGQNNSGKAPNGEGWGTSPVPLAAIESELEKLWKSVAQEARRAARGASDHVDGGSAGTVVAGVSRARVLNFVAYTRAGAAIDGEQALDVVERVVATHPFRTILIVADEGAGAPNISAVVRALSLEGTDGRKIVHEQVRIDANGPVSDGLPSVVLPLLLPDLPTFLWWPGDVPVDHAFWPRMIAACDHVIVDTSAFSVPLTSIVLYADFIRASKKYQTFGDLAWTQLADWRGLISQFFDNPLCAACIDRIASVNIEFSGRNESEAAEGQRANPGVALLLAGWLGSRLNWNVETCRAEQGVVRYELATQNGGKVELALRPRQSNGPRAAIECVHIDTDMGERGAHFAVERESDKPVARVVASLPDAGAVTRSVSIAAGERSTLLARELDQGMRDRPYEEAVAAAAVLASRIGVNAT